jgi:putative ABC transport system substrate-binding protein
MWFLAGEEPMRRRDFITLLGGAAAWPLSARAQQPAVPVVGFLHPGSPEATAYVVTPFRKGLNETGFVEGLNVAIEFRWAYDDDSRLPELAADLVRRRVSVIATPNSNASALAAKAATKTIPIIFEAPGDPVDFGLVGSLDRPGGNVTGFTSMSAELGPKRLGILHELLPGATRFALLANPADSTFESQIKYLQQAVAAIGGQIEVFTARTNREIETAFASLVQKRADALVVGLDAFFATRPFQFAMLAVHHRVPAIYSVRRYTEAGGLMNYGPDTTDLFRRTGIYTGRVLKGEKPGDLPVMRPTKFEFVINMQSARLLGIEIPATLLARADEVIE